jgi:starch synthase
VYFIEKPELFERDYIYGTPSGDYPDNGQRFALFSNATLETLKAVDFVPDVLHVHDWQAAIALAYLKFVYGQDPFFRNVRSLMTIHNLGYQGLSGKSVLKAVGLPERLFNMEDLEFFGKVNFLKAGILYSSAVSTVSHRYSLEIQTPEFGCGLDGLLRKRSDVLTGILNGADYAAWNPGSDPFLAVNFGADDRQGKTECKQDLLRTFGILQTNKDLPVVGMVTRLAGQKGLDILVDSFGALFSLGIQLVILGTGEDLYQKALESARGRYPSFFGLRIAFDETLAHKIVAGSDMLLIPSRYEPCGLTQMYGLKYGTIPVVRATGGLDDSIQEFAPEEGCGNGFKFERYSSRALLTAVQSAIRTYANRQLWNILIDNAMACDFSWEKSAQEYDLLYQNIVGRRIGPGG